MPHVTHYLPELEEAEQSFIQYLMNPMSHDQAQLFATAYRHGRKNPHTVLLTAIVGLVAIPGLQRFWLGQVGMGFLYLFTWGLILIGTIHDLVRYKDLALCYNQRVAREVADNIHLQEAKPRATLGKHHWSHHELRTRTHNAQSIAALLIAKASELTRSLKCN